MGRRGPTVPPILTFQLFFFTWWLNSASLFLVLSLPKTRGHISALELSISDDSAHFPPALSVRVVGDKALVHLSDCPQASPPSPTPTPSFFSGHESHSPAMVWSCLWACLPDSAELVGARSLFPSLHERTPGHLWVFPLWSVSPS